MIFICIYIFPDRRSYKIKIAFMYTLFSMRINIKHNLILGFRLSIHTHCEYKDIDTIHLLKQE